ncbi:MAG: AMP-binding protein [Clostridia bacterium]|nr:AMP-binding protein [Clostridia bacterium]
MDYFLRQFMKNVETAPDAPFLYDEMNRTGLSYARFDDMTGRVYAWLKTHGIGREDFVLLNLPRGIPTCIGMAGVWKAGAAFVIVEENYAPERVEFIRRDCGCKLEIDAEVMQDILHMTSKPGWEETDPHDAAFAVYTSGTTGNPKGVLHEYGNIERAIRSYRIEGDVMLGRGIFKAFISPQSFVAGVIEMIAAMVADHARMVIVSYAVAKNPGALAKLLCEYPVNYMFLSPSYARALQDIVSGRIRTLLIGSEPVHNLYFPGIDMWNVYACSESLFLICGFHLDKPYEITPVGKPQFPLDLRLIDEEGRDVKEEETGEIIVPNPFVRGYINRPEETAATFVNGFYHTGDLAKRDQDGNLIILGRKNDMVKIHGNRVEPGEIENVMKKILGIDWVAVKAYVDDREGGRICAYYKDDISIDPRELRQKLMEYLPYYMIPTYFIHIDEIPLLPNGKLNRRALPEPEKEKYRRAFRAPKNDAEKVLCAGFEKVLGIEQVGTDDDFYELGGDSMRSIQLVLECGLPGLNVGEIFRGRTPETIAGLYMAKHSGEEQTSAGERNQAAMKRAYPLSPEQLYMFDEQLYAPKTTLFNLFMMVRTGKDKTDPGRLAYAVNTAIRAHPSLMTTLFVTEDGEVMQRYTPEKFREVCVEKISEEELSVLKDTLVRPYKIVGEPLHRFRIFETEHEVYMFFDIHHMMFDGTSYQILMKDIDAVYAGGMPGQDYYYLVLEEREKERNSEFYRESREYFEKLYDEGTWSAYPKMDKDNPGLEPGRYELPLKMDSGKLRRGLARYGISRNEFFITAAILAIASYNKTNDIEISWIYNGRSDEKMLTTTGLFYRELPVAAHINPEEEVGRLFSQVHEQVRGGIEHSCYPYEEQAFSVEDEGCACVLYQHSIHDSVKIGGNTMDRVDLIQNKAAAESIFNIEILDGEDGLQLVLDYASALYEKSSIGRFSDLMSAIADRIISLKEGETVMIKELL